MLQEYTVLQTLLRLHKQSCWHVILHVEIIMDCFDSILHVEIFLLLACGSTSGDHQCILHAYNCCLHPSLLCLPCREPEQWIPPGVPRILLSESDFHNPERRDDGKLISRKTYQAVMWQCPTCSPYTYSCTDPQCCIAARPCNSPGAPSMLIGNDNDITGQQNGYCVRGCLLHVLSQCLVTMDIADYRWIFATLGPGETVRCCL